MIEKKPRPNGKFQINAHYSVAYKKRIENIAEMYSISVNELFVLAINERPLVRNDEETIMTDIAFDKAVKAFLGNVTQLSRVISYAHLTKDLHNDYTKLLTVGKSNRKITLLDYTIEAQKEFTNALSFFQHIEKSSSATETRKNTLYLIKSLPTEQSKRHPKVINKTTRVSLELTEQTYKKLLSKSHELFTLKLYDNEEDNLLKAPSITATLLHCLRAMKQIKVSYGFSQEKVELLNEIGNDLNNQMKELNYEKRSKEMIAIDLLSLLKTLIELTARLKRIKPHY